MNWRQIGLSCLTLSIIVFGAGACGSSSTTPDDGNGGNTATKDSGGNDDDATSPNGEGGTTDTGTKTNVKCGNKKVEPPEQCDDGNETDNDGCTMCAYDCSTDDDCAGQIDECSGSTMICDTATHACVGGEDKKEDGTPCGESAECSNGKCMAHICGNSIAEANEECDDGDQDDKDGCTTKCKFTCDPNDPARNCAAECRVSAKCDEKTHTCAAGTAKADGSLCQKGNGYCKAGQCIPGKPDAGDPDLNAVKAGNICDRMATIQCTGEEDCCTTPARSFANFEECKKNMKALCTDSLFVDRVSLNSLVGFDEAYAKTAFASFEQKAAECDPNVALWGISQDGLRGILKGTLAPGSTCTPAFLSAEKYAAALAACKDNANYACMPKEGAWTCEKRGEVGSVCFWDANCIDGIYCDNTTGLLPGVRNSNGKCAARKATGSPCTDFNQCEALACLNNKCVANDEQTAFCLMH